MNTFLNESVEELKRVDHLIFVSLKYTRTVDVLKSVLDRLVTSYDKMLTALFVHKRGQDYLEELPQSHKLKCDKILELYGKNQELAAMIDFYMELRKLNRATHFSRHNEYRRHVTMRVISPDKKEFDVNIDVVNEWYKNAKQHMEFVKGLLH